MTDPIRLSERIDRAGVSAAALRELDTVFDEMLETCMARALELAGADPSKRDADAMLNIALFTRVIKEARGIMKARAVDGQVAHQELARLRKIEGMSPERRRWADMLGGSPNGVA